MENQREINYDEDRIQLINDNSNYQSMDSSREAENTNLLKKVSSVEKLPIKGKHPSYQSLDNSSSPIIFCIHGNRYGVVNCCDELESSNETEGSSKMGLHCHQSRYEVDNRAARKKLIIASILCVLFMIAEIVGGTLANSLAIATDAAHLLTDFASFMISLFSLWLARRPPTKQMSFGWHRAEVIGAVISVLLIWVVTGILFYIAVQRIIYMDFEIEPSIMLITSAFGVIVNIIMGCSLHSHGGHSHENDEETPNDNNTTNKKKMNINVKAAFIHVIGDFIQSMGVFVAALIIFFQPSMKIVDPICTFIFSVLVLLTTIRILKDTLNVLMEGIPEDINFNVVKEIFESVEGIKAVHDLRIWGLTTDKTALSAHLAIAPGAQSQTILMNASKRIRQHYDFFEMTLQIEEFAGEMIDCSRCQNPQS